MCNVNHVIHYVNMADEPNYNANDSFSFSTNLHDTFIS